MKDSLQLNGVQRLRKGISNFFSSKNATNRKFHRELSHIKEAEISCFTLGGFARSAYLYGAEATPKDIDLVFDRPNYDKFAHVFKSCIKKENRFGGISLMLGPVEVDAWCVDETWAFKAGYFKEHASIPSIPSTTYLGIDGILAELWPTAGKARRIFSKGFFETFDSGLLGLNFDPNPFPELTAIRTLVAAKRNSLGLTPPLAHATMKILLQAGTKSIYQAQIKHYKLELFTFEEMGEIFIKLLKHLNNRPKTPFIIFPNNHQRLLPLIESHELLTISPSTDHHCGVQLKLF